MRGFRRTRIPVGDFEGVTVTVTPSSVERRMGQILGQGLLPVEWEFTVSTGTLMLVSGSAHHHRWSANVVIGNDDLYSVLCHPEMFATKVTVYLCTTRNCSAKRVQVKRTGIAGISDPPIPTKSEVEEQYQASNESVRSMMILLDAADDPDALRELGFVRETTDRE